MKVGDMVRIRFGGPSGAETLGVILRFMQEVNENGFVPHPDQYALEISCKGRNFSVPVFESEVVEVISEGG